MNVGSVYCARRESIYGKESGSGAAWSEQASGLNCVLTVPPLALAFGHSFLHPKSVSQTDKQKVLTFGLPFHENYDPVGERAVEVEPEDEPLTPGSALSAVHC